MEDSREKVRIITIINRELLDHKQYPLSPKDFDTLYDLDITELRSAKREILSQLAHLKRIREFSA